MKILYNSKFKKLTKQQEANNLLKKLVFLLSVQYAVTCQPSLSQVIVSRCVA
jgi:hypothetical protein